MADSKSGEIWMDTPDGIPQLTWLVGAIIDLNYAAELDVRTVNGNIVFASRNGTSLRLPQELLAKENHAPDIDYTYLIVPGTIYAEELEHLKGYTVPVAERWTDGTRPDGVVDITRLELDDGDRAFAGLAHDMIRYITLKANAAEIYNDVTLQQKYAAAMAVVLAVLHMTNTEMDLLDPGAEVKLEVMRAGGALGILTRGVTGIDVLPAAAAKAETDIPVVYPGAKRAVMNPNGISGEIAENQIMLGVIDQDGDLAAVPSGAVVRFQEVVVASNATLMGFVAAMEYIGNLPSVIEVVAPFVTQSGITDFLKFCFERDIEVRVVTASIDPALNDNWYVVIPPDADETGKPRNPDYLRTMALLSDNAPAELYYMGDGGDILAFLLRFLHSSAEEVRAYLYPLIAQLADEVGGSNRELILDLIPGITTYIEG